MQDVFNLPQADKKAHIIPDRQLDDFRAGFEISERF